MKKCAAPGCKREFKPVREIQLYCSKRCKNRAAMRRLVKRAQAGRKFVPQQYTDKQVAEILKQTPRRNPEPAEEEDDDESALERLVNAIADGKDLEEISE